MGLSMTTPVAQVSIGVTSLSTVGALASAALAINTNDNNPAVGNLAQISFGTQNVYTPAYIGYVITTATAYTYGDLIFGTRGGNTDIAPTERMRITSGGNVGIGTSSPSNKLYVVASGTATTNGDNSGLFVSHQTSGLTNDGIGVGSNGSASYKWIQSYNGILSLNPVGNNVLIGTTTDDTSGKLQVNGFAKATSYYSINSTVSVPALGTATVLTLSSTAVGVYIINANFGGQGNAVYGSTLIVVANTNNFRIVTNGSGASAALTLSGANVQITNALGVGLDAAATAILIGNL